MDLRLLKLQLPHEARDRIDALLDEHEILDVLTQESHDTSMRLELLIAPEHIEGLVSALDEMFGQHEPVRIVILPVDSTVPMPELEDSDETPTSESSDEADDEGEEGPPINIEELYADITGGIELSWHYVSVTVLSTIVAAVGIMRNDVAVVIAAMIIAPLLGPNMSLSLATTLADGRLAVRSLKVNILGLGVTVGVSFLFGTVITLDPSVAQIALRTKVGVPELLLAISAGAAGALSFTTGAAGRVTGVMIAVALLPPAVVFGMLGGAGRWSQAWGALYLVISNIICVNLSGVVTFFIQRIRPRRAWEAERAKHAFWWALVTWIVLLAVLVSVIVASGAYREI